MHYIVNVSSGLASAEALERTLDRYGKDSTIALFADVKGNSTSEHAGEDADNYRFLADVERYFGIEIIRIVEGRDIWQAMFDARAITIPSGPGRVAKCSIELKREPLDAWIAERYTPGQCVQVTGLDWTEPHRIASFEAVKAPYRCWFPLNEAPYVDRRGGFSRLVSTRRDSATRIVEPSALKPVSAILSGSTTGIGRATSTTPTRKNYFERRSTQRQQSYACGGAVKFGQSRSMNSLR
jgi:hypothetical protein